MSIFQLYQLHWLSFLLLLVPVLMWLAWNRWIEPKLEIERMLEQSRFDKAPPSFSARTGHKAIGLLRIAMIGVSFVSVGVCLWSANWLLDHSIEEYTSVYPRYEYFKGSGRPFTGADKTIEWSKASVELQARRSFDAHSVEVTDDGHGNYLVTARYVRHALWPWWQGSWAPIRGPVPSG